MHSGDRSTVENRLTELEIKLALTEDMLDQLSQTIYRQQQHIDLLVSEVKILKAQTAPEATTRLASLRDEVPPHY